ncbi:hypothetical protein AN960_00910 [Bacillus sp. FJAT-25509]|nr:hypothetical protein AN960_00910 [Bacillus sp. FJAT-25509]
MSILLTLIKHHRYLLLFSVNLLELIALPISGEITMSYSGYLIYQGKMSYIITIFLATLGAIIGITVSYLIGNRFGYNLILKYGKYIHFGPDRYNKTAKWFDQYGNKLLVFAFFIPGIRHFTGYFSGISCLPYKIFARNAYIGAFLWSITFVTLGKVLGPQWQKFHHSASKYLGIGIVGLLSFIVILFLLRRYKTSLKYFLNNNITSFSTRFFLSLNRIKIFIICLAVLFLSMLIFTLGLSEQYLHNEFKELNEVSIYIINELFGDNWSFIMKRLLVLQIPLILLIISMVSLILLFVNKRNLILEFLFFITSIVGGVIFKEIITDVFHYLKPNAGSLLHFEFPNEQSFMSIVVYGYFVFVLIRHLKNDLFTRIKLITPILVLFLLLLIGVANIYFSIQIPSDIIAGYTYGAAWLFLNLLLLEILRLIQQYKTFPNKPTM